MGFVSVLPLKPVDNTNDIWFKKYDAWRLPLGSALSFRSLPASLHGLHGDRMRVPLDTRCEIWLGRPWPSLACVVLHYCTISVNSTRADSGEDGTWSNGTFVLIFNHVSRFPFHSVFNVSSHICRIVGRHDCNRRTPVYSSSFSFGFPQVGLIDVDCTIGQWQWICIHPVLKISPLTNKLNCCNTHVTRMIACLNGKLYLEVT